MGRVGEVFVVFLGVRIGRIGLLVGELSANVGYRRFIIGVLVEGRYFRVFEFVFCFFIKVKRVFGRK